MNLNVYTIHDLVAKTYTMMLKLNVCFYNGWLTPNCLWRLTRRTTVCTTSDFMIQIRARSKV